ncbi:MAG TPA: hypothetical protein GX506_07140, partial [Firmicutes bacterium]|nr:hypothetical protein [Bacillota bacterium]
MKDIVVSERTKVESDVIVSSSADVRATLTLTHEGGKATLRFTSLDAIEMAESALHALYYESLLEREMLEQEALLEEAHEFGMNRT